MPTVYRVSATWTGFQGAPGVSRFSFQVAGDPTSRNELGLAVRTFFTGFQDILPSGTQIQVSGIVDEFDAVSGQLTGSQVMSSIPPPLISTAAGLIYAGGSGLAVTWHTGAIFHGRRIRGRTFIVPIVGTSYSTDGTLSPTVIAQAQTAANTFISGPADLCVWARWYGKPPGKLQLDGAITTVTSASVKDSAAKLASRRD